MNTHKATTPTTELATFAGGCFWCMEPPFKELDGVLSIIPGYTGGITKNPTYEMVIKGKSGHLEAVQIAFNPNIVTYEELLSIYWQQIDPTDPDGQFADRGFQYITAIFYHSKKQQQTAQKSIQNLTEKKIFKKPIVTKLFPASEFYIAEEYHQEYYKKNPIHYNNYKRLSGREDFINTIWKNKK